MISHRTPFFLPYIYPALIWRVPTPEKKIFLTFDDGPVPGPTEFVLDTLKKNSAKATFFCIGDNIQRYPDIFQFIINEKHAVGNHTFNHLNGWRTPINEYLHNVALCHEELEKFLEYSEYPTSPLFRPPYGKITRSQIRSMGGFKIVMWDVLSMDFDRKRSVETSLKKTIQSTRNGSIIVFHDSLKAEKAMTYMLPRLIEHFADKGYTFEALSG